MSKLLLEILMVTMLSSHPLENIASLRSEANQVPLHQFVSFALVLCEFYLILFLKVFSVPLVFSSGSAPIQITQKTIATGLIINEDWELTVDLKIPAKSPAGWKNVFSVQAEGIGRQI